MQLTSSKWFLLFLPLLFAAPSCKRVEKRVEIIPPWQERRYDNIYQSQSGRLYTTAEGLLYFGRGDQWQLFNSLNSSLPVDPSFQDFAESPNGSVWGTVENLMVRIEEQEVIIAGLSNNDALAPFTSIAIDEDENAWTSYWDAINPVTNRLVLARSNGGSFDLNNAPNLISDNSFPTVTNVDIDANGDIWITGDNLYRFNGFSWEHFTHPDISYTQELSVAPDGTVWFTNEISAGNLTLHSFLNGVFTTYTVQNSCLPISFVYNLDVDSQNRLWYQTGVNTIGWIDGNSCQEYQFSSFATITDLHAGDNILISTTDGVYRLDETSGTFLETFAR